MRCPNCQPAQGCTCMKPWMSVVPPPPCPVHSNQAARGRVTVTITATSADIEELDKAMRNVNRAVLDRRP